MKQFWSVFADGFLENSTGVRSMFEPFLGQPQGPTQGVCVADCYYIGNVLDLPFASPIAIYR